MNQGRRFILRALPVLVIGALALSTLSQQPLAAKDPGPSTLRDAWARTEKAGRYKFETRVTQTTLPAARITAAGHTARTQTIVAQGMSDRAAGVLELTVWDDPTAALRPERALEVRIEGSKALGRTSRTAEWKPIGDVSAAFAPAGDAVAFLAAAENVYFLGRERKEVPRADGAAASIVFDRYRFTLNGEQFADTMRKQMEAELERSGDLPAGVRLASSDQFRRMAATGEAWLDAAGMPLRLKVDLEFPLKSNGERDRSSIVTTFLDFDPPAKSLGAAGLEELGGQLSAVIASGDAQRTAIRGGLFALVLVAAIAMIVWRPKRVARPLLAMLSVQLAFAPLNSGMDLQQLRRFTERFPVLTQTAPDKAAARDDDKPPFDPTRSPLSGAPVADKPTPPASEKPAPPAGRQTAPLALFLDGPNTDEDGLEDSLEGPWFTNSANPDSDGDGMSDDAEVDICPTRSGWYAGTNYGDPACPDPFYADTDLDGLTDAEEVLYLGTRPQAKDTDGDGITDAAEVKGFLMPGGVTRRWSDPLNADTDGDGLLDGVECPATPSTCPERRRHRHWRSTAAGGLWARSPLSPTARPSRLRRPASPAQRPARSASARARAWPTRFSGPAPMRPPATSSRRRPDWPTTPTAATSSSSFWTAGRSAPRSPNW